MEILETFHGAVIIVAIIAAVVGGFFMWVGAHLAGVRRATFGKSIAAAVLAALVTWVITGIFSFLPVHGNIIGFLIGVIFSVYVIRGVYSVRVGKALLVWIFYIIAQFVAILVVGLVSGRTVIHVIGV